MATLLPKHILGQIKLENMINHMSALEHDSRRQIAEAYHGEGAETCPPP